MVAFGGITIAAGWIVNSYASSLEMLYLGAALSGIGGGAVYATCVGQAVKWFPDRRGLAVGITAAGFGAGAALTVVPIREVIASAGYQSAFFWFGIGQGVIVFMLVLRKSDGGTICPAGATVPLYPLPRISGRAAAATATTPGRSRTRACKFSHSARDCAGV